MTWTRWQAGAIALAGVASVALCVVPTVSTSSSSSVPGGPDVVTESSRSLLAQQGPSLLLVLAVPLLLALLPVLLGARARVPSAVVLAVLVVLTGFSVGLWFLPALLLAAVAALAPDTARSPAVPQVEPGAEGY